jgi:hypothetical protein
MISQVRRVRRLAAFMQQRPFGSAYLASRGTM